MVDASLAYEILMYLNSFYFGKSIVVTILLNQHVYINLAHILLGLLAFVELGVFVYKMGECIAFLFVNNVVNRKSNIQINDLSFKTVKLGKQYDVPVLQRGEFKVVFFFRFFIYVDRNHA